MSQDKTAKTDKTGQNAVGKKSHRTKHNLEKVSDGKNVTGQNVKWSKCHRTKCLTDKMPADITSLDKRSLIKLSQTVYKML